MIEAEGHNHALIEVTLGPRIIGRDGPVIVAHAFEQWGRRTGNQFSIGFRLGCRTRTGLFTAAAREQACQANQR